MIKTERTGKYKNKVTIIIPAYNEEDIIGETLKNLDYKWIKEIIVINDGSQDNTIEEILQYSVKLVNFKKNKGKGKAVEKGCEIATGEIIAIVDADLGKSVTEIEKLVKPVLNGQAEITIADIPIQKGGLGLVRFLAEKGLSLTSDSKMNAPLSGQRVFKKEILDDIIPFSKRFGLEMGMNIDIIKNEIIFKEVKCDFNHRTTGQSIKGYWHRGKQFLDILLTFWQKRRV